MLFNDNFLNSFCEFTIVDEISEEVYFFCFNKKFL